MFNESNVINRMLKCIISFKKKINKYRVNNVNEKIISDLLINYYGKKIFLSKISKISVENNLTLRITLFDNNIRNIVKKNISLSKLDLNVFDDKNDILVRFSPITEEKRKKIIKLLDNEVELSKISIRNVRREYKNKFRLMLKNKKISINEEQNLSNKLQKIIDIYIKKINLIWLNKKNKFLM